MKTSEDDSGAVACPSGGRMAVRRELAGLTGPQEEHTSRVLLLWGPTSEFTVCHT